ncbi:exodeoxyribonuclease V subunit beta [Orrella sp. 11846]|uniref:exodeoxyribonuclease V subunit beta n=1 Tax=Orrella sp. 11846 TaxID=3409913 RepID=UPI003B5CB4F8
MSQHLSFLDFPLSGSRLIEASAGTGKTYTIAALYVRLVLQHGEENGFSRPLLPPDILVITFTNAATQELRDRIRARLVEAAAYFRQETDASGDEFLQSLRLSYAPETWDAQAFRLDQAAQLMDESAILTIHAWCQRMLREHSFASGSLVNLTIETEMQPLFEEVTRDYWRSQIYPLPVTQKAWLHAHVDTPAKLLSRIHPALLNLELELQPLDATVSLTDYWAGRAAEDMVEHEDLAFLAWHAAHWTRDRLANVKAQRGIMDFSDILINLDLALQGERGEVLAGLIREQFPVAMIDEFQDTDPIQYRIVDRIYQVSQNHPDTGLFLIGDPKQAIYGFRGADIYTYLAARQHTAGRHYTLQKNFRSSHAMVAQANALFEYAQQHQPEGTFYFGKETNSGEWKLPYESVDAHGRSDEWQIDQMPAPALTLWYTPPSTDESASKKLSKEAYRKDMAAVCADTIVSFLNNPDTGFANEEGLQRIVPSDIAVLVRSAEEAMLMASELQARGIRSVYLSERRSIYETDQARDIVWWLQACLHAESEHDIKAALVTPMLCVTLSELEAMRGDEQRWDDIVVQFRGYREIWQRQGVLPMLRRLMHDYEVPQRLLREPHGERSLTNLLHLSESLQQASRALNGQQGLIDFLIQARCSTEHLPDGSDYELRLESDQALVKLVTIHGSKGLEYPLVFLPFASIPSIHKYSQKNGYLSVLQKTQGRALIAQQKLSESDASLDTDAADLEAQLELTQIQESLRLFYVALTRARYACWIGVDNVNDQIKDTPIGHLLGLTGADLHTTLENRAQTLGFALSSPERTHARWQAPELDFEAVCEPAPNLNFKAWWVSSYSQIASHAASVGYQFSSLPPSAMSTELATESMADQVSVDDDISVVETSQSVEQLLIAEASETTVMLEGIHAFKRGAQYGTFLHDLLEKLLERSRSRQMAQSDALEILLMQCERDGLEDQFEFLKDWLQTLLSMTFHLPGGDEFRLDDLSQSVTEMEFRLPVHEVNTHELDRLIKQFVLPGEDRPAINTQIINGQMKGFIDLVFESQGRYYVADYKSNYLADQAQGYTAQRIEKEILARRYDLQYALYTLALHRLLRSRLADYDYDQHVGGAVWMFLRGIDGPVQGLHVNKLPYALIEALDALFAHETQEYTHG